MSELVANVESDIPSLGIAWFHNHPGLKSDDSERDIEIVKAARAGSSAAFDELQKKYSRRLFSTILRVTKHKEDAEDALQETFLRAFLALSQFEFRSSVYSWLTRIALNSALIILRKRRTRREADWAYPMDGQEDYCQPEIEDASPNPEQLCELRQRCSRLINGIQRLQPQLRAPIEIQVTGERSMKEIAKELNISLPAVKARLHRARARLARRIPVRDAMWRRVIQ